MSETFSDTETEQLPQPAGIALRCQLILDSLRDRGPLTWGELVDGLEDALRGIRRIRPSGATIADDLHTLQVGGLVERLPDDPESFRAVESA